LRKRGRALTAAIDSVTIVPPIVDIETTLTGMTNFPRASSLRPLRIETRVNDDMGHQSVLGGDDDPDDLAEFAI
jgi:hypothetical protein